MSISTSQIILHKIFDCDNFILRKEESPQDCEVDTGIKVLGASFLSSYITHYYLIFQLNFKGHKAIIVFTPE